MNNKIRSLGLMNHIAGIAPSDPALAWAMMNAPCMVPQIFPMSASFITGAKDEQINASTAIDNGDNGFESDTVILSIGYQIRQNNVQTGSILKGQQDNQNALNSGINVQMILMVSPKFTIIPNDVPIELAFQSPTTPESPLVSFPYGFVAPKCSSFQAVFTNTRAFAPSGPGNTQNPTEVWVAFRGLSLGCSLETIDISDAVKGLRAAGIAISDRAIVGG